MNVRTLVATSLKPVLANTWAVQLPPVPTWPAMVFEIDTEEEPGWSMGGAYDIHTVNLVVMAKTTRQVDELHAAAKAALEAISPQFLDTEGEGDADFEDDPEVYAKFLIVRLRMRQA
jgi:hypothetical protein